jgi:hypothetical protein
MMKFYLLAIGARFAFRGVVFVKSGMGMAVLAHGHQGLADGQERQADGHPEKQKLEIGGRNLDSPEQGWGHVFMGCTEVEPVGEAVLLAAEEAARWKPDERHWTDYLVPAPEAVTAGSCRSDARNRPGVSRGPG